MADSAETEAAAAAKPTPAPAPARRPNSAKKSRPSSSDPAADTTGAIAAVVRRALHEPRVPPTEFRPYTPKKTNKWPHIEIPPIRTEQWRPIDAGVWQLSAKQNADISMRRYDGKSAAMSVAAIAFSRVYPVADWQPSDINKILEIGRYLHRTSSLRNKADQRIIRPLDIISSFYVDFTKLTTLVSAEKVRGDFVVTNGLVTAGATANAAANQNVVQTIRGCLAADNAGCCLCYDRQRYVAIWHADKQFYVFYPWDHEQRPTPSARVRENCCVRIQGADNMARFLVRLLRPQQSRYHLTAVRILNVQEVSKYPEENPMTCVQRQWSDQSVGDVGVPEARTRIGEETAAEEAAAGRSGGLAGRDGAGDEDQQLVAIGADMMEQFDVAPYLVDFQQSFTPLQSGVEILRGFNYAEQNYRIPCMNVAAIAMLRLSRSFTWTWDTLEEVLSLGHQIYEDNRALVDGPEILATDVTAKIHLGRANYTVEAEQAVFGEMMSGNANVPDLVRALEVFFSVFEAGIVQGPQSVAIWHELGHYYMFDAKERDRFGRKWTPSLGAEHAVDADGNCETVGCCCVTRFLNLQSLVQVYTETVPMKHRHDAFRVTRIEISDYRDRSDDWFKWRGIALGRWIIRGKFYQGNNRFEEDGRNQQATCIGAIAVLFSETTRMNAWDTELVDEILVAGDDLHRQSVTQLRLQETFSSHMLLPSEICKYFRLKENQVQFMVEECVVNGSLQLISTPGQCGELMDLRQGFQIFFGNSISGLLTACDTTLAFWVKDEFYYLFDSHARDENGRNPNACRSNLKKGNLGTSCVQRFAALQEFVNAVLGNLELKNSDAYNIHRLSTVRIEADQSAPLKKYQEFTENIAILRPFAGLHEGNQSLYDLRADKQTLCNLLVALCMAQLNASDNWTKKDLFDILQLGDKMFVGITVRQASQVQDDFLVLWDHIDEVSIGNNRFGIRDVQRNEALLVAPPPPPPPSPADGSREGEDGSGPVGSRESVTVKASSRKTDGTPGPARRTGSKLERLSVTYGDNKAEAASAVEVIDENLSVTKSIETYIPPPELKSLLADWDASSSTNAEAIIETELFQLAVWKQNQMYYIFDPKACDKNAVPTPKRHQKCMHAIRKRIEAAEAEAARIDLENQLMLEQQQKEAGEAEPAGSITGSVTGVQPGDRKVSIRLSASKANPSQQSQLQDQLTTIHEESPSAAGEIVSLVAEPEPSVDLQNEDEDPDATCYVLRFQNIDDVREHILSLVPKNMHTSENVRLIKPHISFDLLDSAHSTNYFYFKMCKNPVLRSSFWLIRASMSQNDQIFPAMPNRNRQDVANCITALSMATFCASEDFTSVILDVILKYGDRLYSKSVQQFKLTNFTDKLNLYQVISPFVLANVKFTFCVEFFASGDLTAERGNVHVRSVYDVLREFLEDNSAGKFAVLVTRQYYVAIWRADDSYFMFDSHDIGPDGLRAATGVAALFRFTDIATMTDVFMRNFDTAVEFNSFQLYRIRVTHSKMPSTVGICVDSATGRRTQMQRPKANSAYSGDSAMRFLHGNTSEQSKALRWHCNPPSACHVVAAMATSREVNAEYWTARVIDEILQLGCELYDSTLDNMTDPMDFDPKRDRLRAQQVRKNFRMANGRRLVHMEMDLFQKGIICPQESGEISLKSGLSKLFTAHSYAVLSTDSGVMGIWRECGYFYVFHSRPMDQMGAAVRADKGAACVYRFETFLGLYQAIMMNIPRKGELGWFEIRRCDFTVTPVAKDQVVVTPRKDKCPPRSDCRPDDEKGSTASVAPAKKCKSKRRTTCFHAISGNCMILRGSAFTVDQERDRVMRRNQTAAIAIVALAMSVVESIDGWSSKTLDLVTRSGTQLYNDARHVHGSPAIRLHHLPRKIFIGDVPLELSILSATMTEAELSADGLFEFFEQHTMAYLVLNGATCLTLLRTLNQFYVFDAMPCTKLGHPAAPQRPFDLQGKESTAVCVLRFVNFQRMLEHLLNNCVAMAALETGGRCKAMLGPIKCARGYVPGAVNAV